MGGRASEVPVLLENVSYRYGPRSGWALESISYRLEAGTLLGLIGPNGSGKTTLYRLLLGLLSPVRGSLAVYGVPAASYRRRNGIGYLPEQVRLPGSVRVRDFAIFVARLAGLAGGAARQVTAELALSLRLEEVLDTRIGTLSHGYKQRVGLLAALLGGPRLLLLDEPANGLDPISTGLLRSVLRRVKREGCSVIVSSHNLLELERVCDAVLILGEGKMLGQASRDDLIDRPDLWVVQLEAPADESLVDINDLVRVRKGTRLALDEVAFEAEDAARDFAARVSAVGCEAESIARRPFDLECLFHSVVWRGKN
jgi:ABC-2 type transport system ATP-binding protein